MCSCSALMKYLMKINTVEGWLRQSLVKQFKMIDRAAGVMWDCRLHTRMPEKTVSNVLRARKLNWTAIQPSVSMINIEIKKIQSLAAFQNVTLQQARTHKHFCPQDQTQASRVHCTSKACFTNASPFIHTLQRIPLTSRCTFATIFPVKLPQSPWKCLTSPPLPTSLILLRKLYYVAFEIANLVEKQWGWKLMSASCQQFLADYLQMGAEVSPGMPCMWLNMNASQFTYLQI